jgi:Leucine-rich repeat (LRR) protein
MTKNMNNHGLSQLKYLYLENNLFEGEISSSFLYSDVHPPFLLTMLDISNNKFSGSLPPHLFDNMPYLTVFDANNNAFTGHFPTILKPNQKLQYLAMHGNMFSGEVSGLLPFLEHLTHLDVSQNQFSEWHIDLGALTNLNYLFLAENDFPPGPIPLFLRSLTNLQELSLKSTQRTGVIPPFFANMTELVLLDLDHNTIQGTIPSELGLLSNLEFLLLNRNKLSGTVPTELGQLSALRKLVSLHVLYWQGK